LFQISRVAQFYGFDPTQSEERKFILQLLAIAHLPTHDARAKELTKIYTPGEKTLYAKELAGLLASRGSIVSLYKFASKALAGRFRSLLPVVGAVTNMGANLRTMEAILDTATTAYHRRMLLRDNF
jgi:hypothetical protein